jgi:hypothetical protein
MLPGVEIEWVEDPDEFRNSSYAIYGGVPSQDVEDAWDHLWNQPGISFAQSKLKELNKSYGDHHYRGIHGEHGFEPVGYAQGNAQK